MDICVLCKHSRECEENINLDCLRYNRCYFSFTPLALINKPKLKSSYAVDADKHCGNCANSGKDGCGSNWPRLSSCVLSNNNKYFIPKTKSNMSKQSCSTCVFAEANAGVCSECMMTYLDCHIEDKSKLKTENNMEVQELENSVVVKASSKIEAVTIAEDGKSIHLSLRPSPDTWHRQNFYKCKSSKIIKHAHIDVDQFTVTLTLVDVQKTWRDYARNLGLLEGAEQLFALKNHVPTNHNRGILFEIALAVYGDIKTSDYWADYDGKLTIDKVDDGWIVTNNYATCIFMFLEKRNCEKFINILGNDFLNKLYDYER